jgi:SAM-dependent methyltransferase
MFDFESQVCGFPPAPPYRQAIAPPHMTTAPVPPTELSAAYRDTHRDTPAVYQRNAVGWDKRRNRALYERPWLDRFMGSMPPGASVLDVGCGAGEPIAEYLIACGLSVTGIDSSEPLIALCQSRFPSHTWRVADMRALEFDSQFDGIIGWDSFFHLSPDEQRQTLELFGRLLSPQGSLLLTVGPSAGEVLGRVEGEAVYHSSLAPEEYERTLQNLGMSEVEMVFEDASCWGRSVLLAWR